MQPEPNIVPSNNHGFKWSVVTPRALAAFGTATTLTVAVFNYYRSAVYYLIFKLTAWSLDAYGMHYLALPFFTPVEKIAGIAAASLSVPDPTQSFAMSASAYYPHGHGTYRAYTDAFSYVSANNSVFDFLVSNILLVLIHLGWIDPYSKSYQLLCYLGCTSLYAKMSHWFDRSFFALLFYFVLRTGFRRISRLPRKLFRYYFPKRDSTPWRGFENLDRLVTSIQQLTKALDRGAGNTSQTSLSACLSFILEPISWIYHSGLALVLALSYPARWVSFLFAVALTVLFYFPSKGFDYFWPASPDSLLHPVIRTPLYRLTQLDFLSRAALVSSLAPQIRHQRFNAFALYAAILQASDNTYWPERPQFRAFRSQLATIRSSSRFLSALLPWKVSPASLESLIADHKARCLAMRTPATTYWEARDVLRTLDLSPYIDTHFADVFEFLTTHGALSDPLIAKPLIRVFRVQRTYFQVLLVLDATWWDIAVGIPGRPSRKPRHHHCIRGISTSVETPVLTSVEPFRNRHEAAAVILGSDPSVKPTPFSYYSTVVVLPQSYSTVAYWDQGSRLSFVSPALVASLGLTAAPTGRPLLLQVFGSGPNRSMEQTVRLEFTIPGLTVAFAFEFIVFESRIAPIVLGENFWAAFDVLCQPSSRFELSGEAIPTLSQSVSALDFEPESAAELTVDSSTPPEFADMLSRFQQAPTTPALPPTRPDDYRIRLKPGAKRKANRPMPRYSLAASEFLCEETTRLLEAGLIEPSHEPDFVVAQLVPKKTGSFRTVFDFRPVNEITDPMPTSLASFRSLMPGLSHAAVFSSLDLQSGYHQLRIADETKPFTTFRTPIGKFQWKVLPFGLCDAPQVFGSYMTDLLRDHSAYARVYLDDILIFSPDPASHLAHVRAVLQVLAANLHVVNWDKCTFHVPSIDWVGHQISAAGISATDTSRGQIQALGVPQDKSDIKAFLGHVGYLQDLIPNFAHRSQPLTALLVKNARFDWSVRCQSAFEDLKNAVLNALPVQSFDPLLPIQVHTDASYFAAAAVLLQPSRSDPTKWYPVEYRSKKFDIHQRNWDIHVKEFWAVKYACQKFRFFLEGHYFTLYTDQQSISQIFSQYDSLAKTTEPLDPRLQRWMLQILHYNFQILFQPGEDNLLADHLSRNPALNPQGLTPVGAVMNLGLDSLWADLFQGAYPGDATFGPVYTFLSENGLSTSDTYPAYEFQSDTGLLYHDSKLCIPHSMLPDFLYQTHCAPAAGHPGSRRWLQWLRPRYHFPDMTTTVEQYVRSCHECQTVKYNASKPTGVMQPSELPTGRWVLIATDLITGFPKVDFEGRTVDAILTIVDKFSNRVHFHAVLSTLSTDDLVQLLLHHHFPLHGLPHSIQSDRGPQFTSAAFQSLLKQLKVESKLSLARHQQSNGRVENRNKLIETYLRLYVALRDDWPQFLAVGEFVLNAQPSTSLANKAPFELDLGYVPSAPSAFLFPDAELCPTRSSVDISEMLDRLRDTATAAHQAAFDNAKFYYDQRHKDAQFEAGQEVYVDISQLGKHLDAHNSQLLPKLRSKFAGPFTIDEVLSPVNYQLIMPPTFLGHPVFHISHLRLKHAIPAEYFTVPHDSVPLKQYPDGSQSVEITEIVGHRKVARGYRLLARCLPSAEFPHGEISEFRASDLAKTAPDLTRAYAAKHRLAPILSFF